MKIRFFIASCLLAFGCGAQAKTYTYQSVPGDILNARIYTLDNGLKVYLSVNKEAPRIQTYIAVRTGSRNDPAETTGLAHYLEHLMFKGTHRFGTSDPVREAPLLDSIQNRFEQYRHITDPTKRKAFYHEIDSISQLAAQYNIPNEYDKLMSCIGAIGTNAYTSNDVTCYTEDIPSNEVENWARIQSDRFLDMVIRGFHTELEAVYEEYNIGLAKDNRKEWAALNAKLYPTHPYGTQTTIGTQEHLKNPSIVNIKNYFNQYYVPNNVAVCMAGDFDPDQVIAIIDKYFGGWKKNPNLTIPSYAPVKDLTAHTDTTVIGLEAENIMVGWKFDRAASLQNDTLNVISNMLSNGVAGLFDINLNQPMKCMTAGAGMDAMNEYTTFLLLGMPNEGQTLDEVKELMLAEIEKIKRGEFSDDLLPSVVSNIKLQYYTMMDDNRNRADAFVNAFINGQEWSDAVGSLDRISHMTKAQIVDFVKRHFGDNYVAVYKRQGEDPSQKKIDKPQITGIPANRDKQSDFVTEIANSKVAPIQPRFVDFKRDLTHYTTKKGLPVLYVKNATNGLFTAVYNYEFGDEADKWLSSAAEYFDYLGTDKMSAVQLKQQFYKLACSMSINVGSTSTKVRLSGLNENMKEAVSLMENFLANAKVDKAAYASYVDQIEKSRNDNKLNQGANFSHLMQYGMFGKYNSALNVPSVAELRSRDPQQLVDLIKGLSRYEHTLLYCGPSSVQDFAAIMDKAHKTAKKLQAVPTGKPYTYEQTPVSEVYLAPYKAKNIYMVQFHNEGRQWTAEHTPVISMFNEYYGGGMNTVVFQELRESRGLAYSASASYNTPWRLSDPETANTYIISQNDKMMDCIHTFNEIIDTMPQSEKAFDLAKQALTKRLASARTVKFDIINEYLSAKRLGIDYSLDEKVYNALPGITLQDIVKFEQETMAKKPYRYLILGDEENLDIKGLEKIGPVRRLTTEEIFGY